MDIRKARPADLDGVAAIYDAVLDDQERHTNFTNWQRGSYPTRATAEGALDAGTLYVLEDGGRLAGCAVFNHEQLPEYAAVPWAFPGEGDRVLVIHTLCIHPDAAGHGYASKMVDFAEQLGRTLGCTALRLDTYEGNLPARQMYTKLGYRLAGEAEFFFQGYIRETLVLFEKAL